SFGLGYARAGARTIVHEPLAGDGGGPGLGDGLGDLTPSSPGASSAGGSNTGASSAAASSASDSPVAVAPSSSEPLSGNGSDAALVVTIVAWAGVRTADNVPAQIPVVFSGGLVALACFIVGGLLLHADIVTGRARAAEPELDLGGVTAGPGEAEARRRAAVLARQSR